MLYPSPVWIKDFKSHYQSIPASPVSLHTRNKPNIIFSPSHVAAPNNLLFYRTSPEPKEKSKNPKPCALILPPFLHSQTP